MVSKSVILLFAVLAAVQCHPAEKTIELHFPLDKQTAKQMPVLDVNADSGFQAKHPNTMSGFFGSLETIMAAMSDKINEMFKSLPPNYHPKDANIIIPLPDFQVPNLRDLTAGKGNTTSVTRMIKGHQVTINETQLKKEDKNDTSFIKVRVVNVHPNANGVTKEDIEEITNILSNEKDPSSIDENEVISQEEVVKHSDKLHNFMKMDSLEPLTMQKRKDTEWSEEWDNPESLEDNDLQNIESFEINDLNRDSDEKPFFQPFRDLSNDIYVNDLLEKSGQPINPDAEVFNINEKFSSNPGARYSIVDPEKEKKEDKDFLKDSYYSYYNARQPSPVADLSNDIYVNQILANSGAPTNPDAEVFDVDERGGFRGFRGPQMFEKLKRT